MAGVQQGLQVAFYLYPVGLFATLLGSQSVQYYRERHGKPSRDATADDQQAEATRRFYARLIWCFQLVLSLLLVSPNWAPRSLLDPGETNQG
jgi:ATP-binding cassette, subfamily B, vacuolar membrane transporter HMT1/ACLQ